MVFFSSRDAEPVPFTRRTRPVPPAEPHDDGHDAIRQGRRLHGVGLAEARESGEVPESPVFAVPPPLDDVRKRRKLAAIKLYRKEHNATFQEAKDAVDAIEAENRSKRLGEDVS